MARKKRSSRRKSSAPASVFLNIPYDDAFLRLYLAYIAAVSAFGLIPQATLVIPGGTRRLERIIRLIKGCEYSIHDLSRVQLDRNRPRTPRFNMPFELGLAVALQHSGMEHTWFVAEQVRRRVQKSLSDLDGTDAHIHEGTIEGVFREVRDALVREARQPTVADMKTIYKQMRKQLPEIMRAAGATSAFGASVFRDLCVVASAAADRIVT
jgi:hypothetical protein